MREKDVVILEGKTEIITKEFSGAKNVGSPVFPTTLKKIWNCAFAGSDIEEANLPEGLKIIDKYAFAQCKNLKKATIPSSIQTIDDNCFYESGLEELKINNGVHSIGKSAFGLCEKLKKVELPPSVETIGSLAFAFSGIENFVVHKNVKFVGIGAFNECKDIIVETKNGTRAKVPSRLFFYETIDLENLRAFIENRSNKYSFIPNTVVINNTPKNMIENFYSNSRGWEEVLKEYCKSAGENGKITYHARKSLYKICLAMGLFSENGTERQKAKQFLLENIVNKYDENILTNKFEKLNTKQFGYNKEFAKFVLENYSDINFLEVNINNDHENSLFSLAYNGKFDEYMKLTNKIVKTNKMVDKLTEENIITHILGRKYAINENDKNDGKIQQLANYCASFGYTQKQFETLVGWLKVGIERGSNIKCFKDTKTEGISFEFLEKNNPIGAVIGDITNCCQSIDGSAPDCVKHGMTNKNGGFMAFKHNERIIGQAWVWYNQREKKICLDNIEVPNSAISVVNRYTKEFIDCIARATEALKNGMKEQAGIDIEIVTTGIGHNDVAEILMNNGFKKFDAKEKTKNAFATQSISIASSPIGVYTDTKDGEIVLWENSIN